MKLIDTNKVDGKKARWEQHKNAVCSFDQSLEVKSHKIYNHSSKIHKTCALRLEKQVLNIDRKIPFEMQHKLCGWHNRK